MLHLQAAQSVVAGAEIELSRASAQGGGRGTIRILGFIGIFLNESESVLRESPRRREQQPLLPRVFGEQGLDQFQAEGYSGPDQIGIVIGSKSCAARGERVTECVDRVLLNRARGQEQSGEHDGGPAEHVPF